MADPIHDPACDWFRDAAAEFALGVLPGEERAEALKHLEQCPACRALVVRLTSTRDRLIELVPEAEPPAGFERLVLARVSPRRRPRSRYLVPAAAAAAAVLIAGGFAAGRLTAPAPPVVPATALAIHRVELTLQGRWVGSAFAYPGDPSFVYVSLDTKSADQNGSVTLGLERPDGSWIPLGNFPMRRGYGNWGASAQLDGNALRSATLVVTDAGGHAIASAPLG